MQRRYRICIHTAAVRKRVALDPRRLDSTRIETRSYPASYQQHQFERGASRELGGHPVSVGILSKSCGDWDLMGLFLAPDTSLWSSMTIA